MKRLSIVAISLILLVNFSCKSSKIKDPNKVNDKVLLTIKDYIIENKYDSNIDLVLEITNNSSEPIYILKASEDNFALPSLYDVSINPKIESCEIWEVDVKPISFFLEIKPNTKDTFIYEGASFGVCEDIKGKTFELSVVYEFDSSNTDLMNEIKEYYKDEPQLFEQIKKLSNLKLTSNLKKVKVPKD